MVDKESLKNLTASEIYELLRKRVYELTLADEGTEVGTFDLEYATLYDAYISKCGDELDSLDDE